MDCATLAGQLDKSVALLDPLADALRRQVLSYQFIFADEAPVKMLASGNSETRKSRLWAFDRDERPWRSDAPLAAWYQFMPDRKGILPGQHLMDNQGWMSADGYAGFEEQYRAGWIKEVICMTYVGGKFVDVSKLQGLHNADQAIQRISQLCGIKRMKRGFPLKQLIMVRQVTAKVIL